MKQRTQRVDVRCLAQQRLAFGEHDARDGGEMNDAVAALERRAEAGGVANVAARPGIYGSGVEHADVVTAREEAVTKRGADQALPTGDKYRAHLGG